MADIFEQLNKSFNDNPWHADDQSSKEEAEAGYSGLTAKEINPRQSAFDGGEGLTRFSENRTHDNISNSMCNRMGAWIQGPSITHGMRMMRVPFRKRKQKHDLGV